MGKGSVCNVGGQSSTLQQDPLEKGKDYPLQEILELRNPGRRSLAGNETMGHNESSSTDVANTFSFTF